MKIILPLLLSIILLGGCQIDKNIEPTVCNSQQYLLSLPKDIPSYRNLMAKFSQEGGENPLNTVEFVSKCIDKSSFKTLAEQSAKEILPQSHKTSGRVTHFKIRKNVAYVELAAHKNGWPGVSASLSAINPIIIRNLFLNSKVEDVVVGKIGN
ncbi:putative lipoprotein [Aliivibrio wodanis]|uniref:Putative lipoprotein n=1 Tax=Aliivibrio wodanis TaxID=80852 RepID=A0A090JZC1_9GAMM|nr:putative lipoprotein [Aliivibrio wodanis]VVV06642.1 hypothetical protein AW0309160_04136 [Aliivibrio wodanis]